MHVRSEHTAYSIAFHERRAPSWTYSIDALHPLGTWRERRVATRMAPHPQPGQPENRVAARLDLDVAERLQALGHRRLSRDHPHPRPHAPHARADALAQVHER